MTDTEKIAVVVLLDMCGLAFAEAYNNAKKHGLSDDIAFRFAELMIRILMETKDGQKKSIDKSLEEWMLKATPGGRA